VEILDSLNKRPLKRKRKSTNPIGWYFIHSDLYRVVFNFSQSIEYLFVAN